MHTGRPEPPSVREKAEQYEKDIVGYLSSIGIVESQYRTEEQQRADIKESITTRQRPTPDILFHVPVTLPGCTLPLRWLECKHFFGLGTRIQLKNIKKQAKKYVETFGGIGAFVFRNGFSQSMVDVVAPNPSFHIFAL